MRYSRICDGTLSSFEGAPAPSLLFLLICLGLRSDKILYLRKARELIMMLEIHLYGKLRSLIPNAKSNEDTVLEYDFIENETFAQLVRRLGLNSSDLGDCFLNGTLVKPGDRLSNGDRLGMFPFNMVLLCGGQHLKGHGYTRKDVDVDYY